MSFAAASTSGMLGLTRKAVDSLLVEIGGLLADLTSQEHPTEVSEDEENEKARRVIDVELQRFWQGYYELKQRHEENALSVAVLALTKSGKSTLLNALLGMEVLPMNNVPETARICRITHDAAAREPVLCDATGRALVRGEAAIRTRLQQLNSAARTSNGPMLPQPSGGLEASAEDLTDDVGGGGGSSSSNRSGRGSLSSVLHISAPLVALDGFGPEFGRVTLMDTPGPNEAGEEQLKYQVERLLEGVDCVLYLLDYTKLKTAEEEGLFRRLRAINPQLVARLSSRLFFVINKVDASETSEGLDPEEVRQYVADLVTRQLGGAAGASAGGSPSHGGGGGGSAAAVLTTGSRSDGGSSGGSGTGDPGMAAPAQGWPPFRLHPEQVLLLSARNALMARLVLTGRATPDAAKRFQRLAFGAFGGASFGGFGVRSATVGPSNEQVRAAAGCLLEGSGILELESRVLAFLAAHAGSVKLLATADDLNRLLAQVRNVALTCRSCLHRNVAALQEQEGALRAELAEATVAFENVRSRTDAVQAEVVAEIKAHLNTLRRRLFTHIVQTLDTDARAPPPAAPAVGQPPTSRWHCVREKFLSMFTGSCSTLPPQPHGSGPRLVPQARSRSREELQSLLLDLHDDLMGQIHSEVYDFWGILEACVTVRHSELLSALNGHLAALSQRVEGAVSETLGVQLAAADIRLRPPSAEQLHSDVQELIEKGIRESTEKHIRVGARTTTERVFQQPQGPPSLCRWGGYWVEVPRTRTVVETYTATVYSLRPDEIANHFIGLVDSAVTASERALGAYVGALVERQLEAAKERIRDYGDRYLSVMSAALSASSRGAECRSSVLASVEGYLARLDDLLARAQAAQREAETVVPGGATSLMDEVEVYDDVYEGGYDEEYAQSQQEIQDTDNQSFGAAEDVAGDVQQRSDAQVLEPQPVPPEMAGITVECNEALAFPMDSCEHTAQAGVTRPSSLSGSSAPDIDDADAARRVLSLAASVECADVIEGAEDVDSTAVTVDASGADSGRIVMPEAGQITEAAWGVDVITRVESPLQIAKTLNDTQAVQPPLPGVCVPAAASALPSGSMACVPSSYTAAPFDYSRAFLEAMSSSEMATVTKLDEPLTTISLVANGDGGGLHGEGAMLSTARDGNDTPRSGESEDWQFVGEESLEAPEAACGKK